jgi:hypothetical protein
MADGPEKKATSSKKAGGAKKLGGKKGPGAKKLDAKKGAGAKKIGAKKAASSSPRVAVAPSHSDIRERAYLIHERQGGNAVENWLQAERELGED